MKPATMPAIIALLLIACAAGAQQAPLAGTMRLPLNDQKEWQALQYSSLPPHRLKFSATGLQIEVENSAMPVIHPLAGALRVSAIRVRGHVEGTLRIPPGQQGEPKFDDYVFRIGLVESGERQLNFVQRQIAPAWVRKLYELAPPGGGISRIHFFNVGAEKAHLGRQRQHPLSELIVEKVVALPRAGGRFDFEHALDRPLDTVAVWLSSDGDDSHSSFTVLVEEIELIRR